MKNVLVIFLVIVTISCDTQKKVTPIFYEISNDKNKVYILGSIHTSDGSIIPLPNFIMEKFHQSEEFFMELKPSENDTLQYTDEKIEDEYYLKDHVSEETYQLVIELSKNLSIPQNILIKQKPSEIIIYLEEYELNKAGITKEKGIESYLYYEAKIKNIKIDGFDSYQEMMKNINAVDEKENEKRLKSYILNRDEIGEDAKEFLEFWKEGNEEKLVEKIENYSKEYSEIIQYLLRKRNQKMIYSIEEMLKSNKQIFIAVGLGHIIGNGNIIDILREKGYLVNKIKAT